jgi:hypothetical protein
MMTPVSKGQPQLAHVYVGIDCGHLVYVFIIFIGLQLPFSHWSLTYP